MRFFKGLAGVLAGTGLIATGATVVVGCGEDFDGCEASRTCKGNGASGGVGGTAGAANGGHAASGADGGADDQSGGKSGNASNAGKAGSATAGKAGRGGAGGTSSGESGEGGESPARGGTAGAATTGGTTSTGNGGESGQAGDDSGPPVDEPPRIIATSPKNGEKGVLHEAEIVVTFSEPMDNETTEHAYSSEDLPQDKVALSWTENSTKLHIRPIEPLAYATVHGLDGDAKHYEFTIGGTATDVAGNPLGDDRNFGFSTMRHVNAILVLPDGSYGIDLSDPGDGSGYGHTTSCAHDVAELHAGDKSDNTAMEFVVGFDLGVFPDGVIEWSSASIYGAFRTTSRNPFTRLGALRAYGVEGDLATMSWDPETTADFGATGASASSGDYEVDVLDELEQKYTERSEYPFSVLFRFEDYTDSDDELSYIVATCDSVRLSVSFTGP